MRRLARSAILAGGVVVALAAPAGAIETGELGIEPVPAGRPRQSFHETIRPGRITRDAVRVFNKTSRPITVRLWVEQASIDGEGQARLGGGGGAAGWVGMPTGALELAPRSARSVPFEVRAPRELPPGGALVAIMAEAVPEDPRRLAVLQRLAVIAYLEPAHGAPLRSPLGWPLVLAAALLGVVAMAGAIAHHRRGTKGSGAVPAAARLH